mmetsp:Transcript_21736/g.26593  ORF Transcript_21736/g.26593 Transcript_21736/m.26593 type:complete len:199 (+) Transcript_21736:23-619(+)
MTTITRRRCGRKEGFTIQTFLKVTRNIICRNTHSIKVLLFIAVISFAKVSAVGRMSLDEFIQRDKYDKKNDRNLLGNFPIEHPENIRSGHAINSQLTGRKNGEYGVSDGPKPPTRNRLFAGDGRKSNKGTATRQPKLGKGTETKQPKSGKGIVRSRTKQPSSGKGGISGKGRNPRGTDPAVPISNDYGEIPRSQLFEP